MSCTNDCGPTAMLAALRQYFRSEAPAGLAVSREQLLAEWGFREGADRLDTPGHHARVLRALEVPFSMRRRLAWRDVQGALIRGRAVVLLVPTGRSSWHWIALCGLARGPRGPGLALSAGDGLLRSLPWEELRRMWARHAASRLLRVDGLGYSLGSPPAFEHDQVLERDMARLANLAEETLAPAEPAWRAVARRLGLSRRPTAPAPFERSGWPPSSSCAQALERPRR